MTDLPLIQAISSAAIPKLPQFRPQELANTAWACAVCAFPSAEPLAEAIAAAALRSMAQCASKDLANIAWAFETMPYHHLPLMHAIAAASLPKCGDFNAQDLSNTVWSFASQSLRNAPLLEAIAAQAIPPISNFCPPELASTAWSFSPLAFHHTPLLASIAAASIPRMGDPDFDQHSLASIAWSYATLLYHDSPLRDSLAAASLRTMAEANAQDLANTAWSVATLEFKDAPLLTAIAAAARAKLPQFEVKEIEMTVWALSQLEDLSLAWEVAELADSSGRLGALGFGALLSECALRRTVDREIHLLQRFRAPSLRLGLGPAALGCAGCAAARRLAALSGDAEAALAALGAGPPFAAARQVAAACGEAAAGRGGVQAQESEEAPGARQRWPRADAAERPEAGGGGGAGSKAAVLLPYVLRAAAPGDAAAVCAAFEECSRQLLRPARQWFKIAGGRKAEVVADAIGRAPAGGSVLEVGTYLGYSAIRLAASQPGRRVVTLEVDPGSALAAECLIAHAGLAHRVDVWTGHSKDLFRRLPDQYPPGLDFAAVFMDQCGSRFWADLEALLQLGLLRPGAVIVADNVLKPGAPLFLWRAFFGSGGLFRARCVSVPEFAMPGVEDWVAVLEYAPRPSRPDGNEAQPPLERLPEPPPEVLELEWEAQQLRARASRPGSVDFGDWAAFAAWMRRRLAELGIRPEPEGA